MRTVSVLAVSAAVHAAVIGWTTTWKPELPVVRPPAPPSPPIEITVAPPSEVVLLDEATTAALEDGVSDQPEPEPEPAPGAGAMATTGRATRGTSGASETGTNSGAESGSGAGSGSGSKNPWMDMRKGRPVRLTVGVPTGRWDGRASAPETYGPDLDSGKLHESGGGTHRSDEGVFTAKVERDGSVSLKDAKNLRFGFRLPGPKGIGNAIARWYRDDNKPVGTLGPPDLERYEREQRGERGKPGTPMDEPLDDDGDGKPDNGGTVAILGGGFDVTDALMRKKGIDPYAAKKLQYLDATRDERVQIGLRHRQAQLLRATEIMQGNLDRAWASTTDPAARREALFELWDECAETGPAMEVEAGAAARSLVVGFIRSKLPAGTTGAYTPTDLARFNAKRTSTATFAPYSE